MKKVSALLFFVLTSIYGYGAHIIGYDMSITNIPNTDQFLFQLRLYRDNTPGTAAMPVMFQAGVYSKINPGTPVFTINAVREYKYIPNPNPNECYAPNSSNMIEVGVFVYTISEAEASLLNNPNGYYLVANDCCRKSTSNVPDTDESGYLYTMEIPRLDTASLVRRNSTPMITATPRSNFVVGKIYDIDWSATDADGDSLIYSLTPSLNGSIGLYPFSPLDFSPGYKLDSNIADGAPDFNINQHTGIGSYKPTRTGVYAVSMKIEEYRSGVKIGESRREIIFLTIIAPEFPPIIQDQNNSSQDIVDTIHFAGAASINYSMKFTASDSPNDSVFMHILPNFGGTLPMNVLDPNLYKATWGEVGKPVGGASAQNLVLYGSGSVTGEFNWEIFPAMGSDRPFEFTVVARDQTCQGALIDSFKVKLYVPFQECYVQKTINITGCDSVLGINNKIYYQTGTYYDTTSIFANCDTSYLQLITVHTSPTKKQITGDQNPVLSYQYTYYFERQNQNACTWLVENATLLYEDDSVAVIKFDTVALATITVIEWDNTTNCGTSNTLEVDVRSLGVNIDKTSQIKVYPNPSANKIYIEGIADDKSLIEIYSVDGKKIQSSSVRNKQEIDISDLQSGVYILKVEGQSRRIIKM